MSLYIYCISMFALLNDYFISRLLFFFRLFTSVFVEKYFGFTKSIFLLIWWFQNSLISISRICGFSWKGEKSKLFQVISYCALHVKFVSLLLSGNTYRPDIAVQDIWWFGIYMGFISGKYLYTFSFYQYTTITDNNNGD